MNAVDELVALIDAAVAAGEVRMVFWVCPVEHPAQHVTWSHSPAGSIPTCVHCGTNGPAR